MLDFVRRLIRGRRPGERRAGPAYGETARREGVHVVSLRQAAEGARFEAAQESLRNQLGGRAVGEPDERGFFEVEIEASSWDDAVAKVRDAVASAGADDAVELGEPSGVVRS